jgi:ParB/RepB/Spo0J family partition protein
MSQLKAKSSGLLSPQVQHPKNDAIVEQLKKRSEMLTQPTTPEPTEEEVINTVNQILLSEIDDSPYQPRLSFDPERLDELAQSMAATGRVEEPITVRRIGNRFQLIAGARRVKAARILGWHAISAHIVVRDDRNAELSTLINNEGRDDLSDYERGLLYKQATDHKFVRTQAEAAKLFATSQSTVSGCLAMLQLPEPFIAILRQHPKAFGRSVAKDIAELLAKYPKNSDAIERGVRRLVDDGAAHGSLRSWVEQAIANTQRQSKKADKPTVVTNPDGKQLYSAKVDRSSRKIIITINDPDVDPDMVTKWLTSALRDRVNSPKDK